MMQADNLINEIERLPKAQKQKMVEEIIKLIRKDEVDQLMEMAVEELYGDYANDVELTEFTSLDLENFFETK